LQQNMIHRSYLEELLPVKEQISQLS